MTKENIYDREIYPFKTFLEEAFMQQRNKMMDNFSQILQILSMAEIEEYSTRIHFRGATPFKVQVNFDIPLFEG
jgi:hypothetical protein